MTDIIKIKTVQFKRGLQRNLEAKLKPVELGGIGIPLAGEPVFEQDTGKLKIGDGEHAYIDLEYVSDARFIIQNPLDNQILFYNENIEAWENRALADDESLEYTKEHGLTIKGYNSAHIDYIPVKKANGIVWEDYKTNLNNLVQEGARQAVVATNAATNANSEFIRARDEANRAEGYKEDIIKYIEAKFWWGSAEEYNALDRIEAETFYFIKTEG